MARETKLTPERQKTIVDAIRGGCYFVTACQLAGIDDKTGYRWLSDQRPMYREFRDAVKNAEAAAEAERVLRIRQAATGGKQTTRRTIKIYPNGTQEITETTEIAEPNWTADAWFLERKFPARWGKQEKIQQEIRVVSSDEKIDSILSELFTDRGEAAIPPTDTGGIEGGTET